MAMEKVMQDKRVSKSEFKAKALEFFRQIESSGESMIVTDHGKPALPRCRAQSARSAARLSCAL
jgi:hypothetical protein